MDGPFFRDLHAVLILFQSLVEAKFFLIQKILIATIIQFIQHSFVDCLNFYL